MTIEKPSLDSAYALSGTAEVRALYRDWARTYDDDFIARLDYRVPALIAATYRKHARNNDAPILDVGCGSGVVGMQLAGRRVDGIDLSAEMLSVAVEKGVYTRLIEGNLLEILPLDTSTYGAIVSAGTFTHGHVGPAALDELLRIAAPGALFCLGINAEHFAEHGFGAAFAELHRSGAITEPSYEDHPIYGKSHEHSGDRALIAVFRRSSTA